MAAPPRQLRRVAAPGKACLSLVLLTLTAGSVAFPLTAEPRCRFAARVTTVLEQIRTAEAREILEALAKEHASGVLTREAKASLARLGPAR